MFEKTLPDMIKGIRANPGGEAAFIATCITECRKELTEASGVPGASVRQNAVLKLIYLQSLGHDVSWAAFHIVDVMASPRFRGKRIGFLAASQTFTDSTDVLLLTTNLFRKAFASSAQHEASVAVGCLARIATPDLSRDLLGDVSSMLSSSRPLLRKKAVLCTYKLVVRSPDALAQAFPRLRERLDDPDPSVVACTVNVLTELAAASPKAYLGLAPALYKVLTTSSSNWTLIKVVKFLRQLVPHEPRLAKKLVQPLTHLIETTPAKSLQFECLYTVATTMASSQPELARLASSRLRDFVESPDPNLKSLGLLALAALQTSDKTLVEPCRDAVLRCLDDEPSVRAAALNLIAGMVTRQSLPELVQKLLGQVQVHANAYRDDVISVVLSACRADGFGHVPSFRWLVTTLLAVAALRSKHGVEVARLLLEVTLRVPTVRGFAVERCLAWMVHCIDEAASAADGSASSAAAAARMSGRGDDGVGGAPSATDASSGGDKSDTALLAASYVLGEHSALLPPDDQLRALRMLLSPTIAALASEIAPEVQASCVQAALRVIAQLPTSTAAGVGAGGIEGGLLTDGGGAGGTGGTGVTASLLASVRTSLLPFARRRTPRWSRGPARHMPSLPCSWAQRMAATVARRSTCSC